MKNTFLNPTQKKATPGISLFTAVKNRREFLEKALETWLVHDEIDEIIIVDWTSDESLIPWIKKINNKKVFLVSVTDQERKWSQVPAFNLAARFTTKDKLLKMDADVTIRPGFFQKHILAPDIFYTGDWSKSRDENEKHLNGAIFVDRDAFFRVNGYNEFIRSYGYDDTDLYHRLEETGMKRRCFDLDTLYHLPHQNRTQHQTMTDFVGKQDDFERSNINILMNRYLCEHFAKWSVANEMLDFTVEISEPNIFLCKQTGRDLNLLSEKELNEAKFNSVRDRLDQLGFSVNANLLLYFTPEELVELYHLFHRRDLTTADSQLYSLINKFNYHFSYTVAKSIEEINILGSQNADKDYFLKEKSLQLAGKDQYIEEITRGIKEKERYIEEITRIIQEKDQYIEGVSHVIAEKDKAIQNITLMVHQKEEDLQKLYETYMANVREIHDKESCLQNLASALHGKEQMIAGLDQQVYFKNQALNELGITLQSRDHEIEQLKIQETEQNNLIAELTSSLQSTRKHLDETISEQNSMIDELTQTQSELELRKQQLDSIYKSYSWRFGHGVFSLFSRINPISLFYKKNKPG